MKDQKPKGLGRTISKLRHATGFDKLAQVTANLLGKKDCGCNKAEPFANTKTSYIK